jgi:hypothetical protein
MRNETPQLWFKSDIFTVEPNEDEETNPFCYGKQLATWVAAKFCAVGYSPEPIIAEDWGWCVMLARKPFLLWIACGSDRFQFYESVTPEEKSKFVPRADQLKWTCFVGTDVLIWTPFFWQRLLGRANTTEAVTRVGAQLEQFLRAERGITLTEPW